MASAFFPDPGRNELVIYPSLFDQSSKEQLDTMIHEIGHIFGLRHFFAQVSETSFPSINFGRQNPFTIMNYGFRSELTNEDKSDLKELYNQVWNGNLTAINNVPIHLFRPFHTLRFINLSTISNSSQILNNYQCCCQK